MSRWVSKPVEVDAHEIVGIEPIAGSQDLQLELENGMVTRATQEMLKRCFPRQGDFLVIQRGYSFLKPRALFLSSYDRMPVAPEPAHLVATSRPTYQPPAQANQGRGSRRYHPPKNGR